MYFIGAMSGLMSIAQTFINQPIASSIYFLGMILAFGLSDITDQSKNKS